MEFQTPNLPNYLPRTRKRRRYRFTTARPWQDEFKKKNEGILQDFIHLEPIKDWLVFRGDRVEVLAGRDTGKQGIVSQVGGQGLGLEPQHNWSCTFVHDAVIICGNVLI